MDLSTRNIGDIKHASLIILIIYVFKDYLLFFNIFINIYEYEIHSNRIICIFDPGMKGICLSFNLVPLLVVYGKK